MKEYEGTKLFIICNMEMSVSKNRLRFHYSISVLLGNPQIPDLFADRGPILADSIDHHHSDPRGTEILREFQRFSNFHVFPPPKGHVFLATGPLEKVS